MLRLGYEMQRDLGKMYWLLMAGKETPGRMTYFQPLRTVAIEEISSRTVAMKEIIQIGVAATASASTRGVYSKPTEQKGSVGKTGEAPAGQP